MADPSLLVNLPRVTIEDGPDRGGTVHLNFGNVRFGHDVEIEFWTGSDAALILRDGVRASGGARFGLRGGSIDIGEQTLLRDFCVLKSRGELRVGTRCCVSFGSVIHCDESVTLGDGASLADHVSVLDSDHKLSGDNHIRGAPVLSSPVHLADHTIIFANCTVLRGTTTGIGCVAAAGSVLRGEYPTAALVAGAPAEVVRSLSERPVGEEGPFKP